jgi:hypothetical protein
MAALKAWSPSRERPLWSRATPGESGRNELKEGVCKLQLSLIEKVIHRRHQISKVTAVGHVAKAIEAVDVLQFGAVGFARAHQSC